MHCLPHVHVTLSSRLMRLRAVRVVAIIVLPVLYTSPSLIMRSKYFVYYNDNDNDNK